MYTLKSIIKTLVSIYHTCVTEEYAKVSSALSIAGTQLQRHLVVTFGFSDLTQMSVDSRHCLMNWTAVFVQHQSDLQTLQSSHIVTALADKRNK